MTSSTSEPAAHGGRQEPIAVIGMACRLPGAASPVELWTLLRDGVDATSRTPVNRYDVDTLYSPLPVPGKVISRRSGYLDGVGDFDASFFDMSPGEANQIDPRQRLLMMTAWEAFEDAGLPPERVAGSRTGVYVGSMHLNYWDLRAREGLTGLTPSSIYSYRSMLAGRLSYTFDLRGPSMTLDTACSSSLAAIHIACQSLRVGESTLALVAGVNLKLTADEDVLLSQVRMLAADGRCKFGDVSADGFAPSDGVGVVILKPLGQALADRDPVRAVILGSAVTNDGAGSGSMLAPSTEGYVQAMLLAYRDAGVAPADVDFIEAHGTGTPTMDPVEFAGLGEVLDVGRPEERPCFVGSVKTNIGHSEGAAGVAALMKTVLCLEHRQVVPSLHFNTPNPRIAWNDLPLRVSTRTQRLPDHGRPLVAGISGHGMASIIAHIVVQEAPPTVADDRAPVQRGRAHLLPLSARTPGALADLARAYIDMLESAGTGEVAELRDICYSAAVRRQHHAHRLAVVATSHAEFGSNLRDYLLGRQAPGLVTGSPVFAERENIAGEQVTNVIRMAHRYVAGISVDWSQTLEQAGRFVRLPTYRWQKQSYWPDNRPNPNGTHASGAAVGPGR